MPFLQSSGAISINDIRNMFGGPSSPALSNYYRGGSFIPASKSTVVRDPASGDYFALGPGFNDFRYWGVALNHSLQPYAAGAYWLGTLLTGGVNWPAGSTSQTVGGFTYFRGSFRERRGHDHGADDYYGIFRTSGSTVSINAGIPSSGQISISQFYGAEKP